MPAPVISDIVDEFLFRLPKTEGVELPPAVVMKLDVEGKVSVHIFLFPRKNSDLPKKVNEFFFGWLSSFNRRWR